MKKMSNFTLSRPLCGLLLSAAILGGCASTPEATPRLTLAQDAIADAVSAGALELAPAELKAAQQKLDDAHRANAEKDREKAVALAEQAEADARLAESKARTAKSEKAAQAIQDDIKVLREELNRKSQ